MSGFVTSCRIKVNAVGDWQLLPPAGEFSRIGSAGIPILAADEDDLFISNDLEVGGDCYSTGGGVGGANALEVWDIYLEDAAFLQIIESDWNSIEFFSHITEEITIPVGQGAATVWGAEPLNPADSVIQGVVTRITQSPGGGATLVNVGRAVNIDEYLDDGTVNLGDTSTSAADGDGVNVGWIYNDASRAMGITTDCNVTISDMKIRVTTFYIKFYPHDS